MGTTPLRLVIIDDDPSIHRVFAALAEHDDRIAIVAHATTAVDGVDVVRELSPDAVIVDHRLHTGPRVPRERGELVMGLEVVAVLRQQRPDALIVVYSGIAGLDISAKNVGADLYLEKGDDPHEVIDRIVALAADATGTDR